MVASHILILRDMLRFQSIEHAYGVRLRLDTDSTHDEIEVFATCEHCHHRLGDIGRFDGELVRYQTIRVADEIVQRISRAIDHRACSHLVRHRYQNTGLMYGLPNKVSEEVYMERDAIMRELADTVSSYDELEVQRRNAERDQRLAEQAKADVVEAAAAEVKQYLERQCDAFKRMQKDEARVSPGFRNSVGWKFASAEWSRELREKVKASEAAAAARERNQVVVDLDLD